MLSTWQSTHNSLTSMKLMFLCRNEMYILKKQPTIPHCRHPWLNLSNVVCLYTFILLPFFNISFFLSIPSPLVFVIVFLIWENLNLVLYLYTHFQLSLKPISFSIRSQMYFKLFSIDIFCQWSSIFFEISSNWWHFNEWTCILDWKRKTLTFINFLSKCFSNSTPF